jgi:ubiquinone/menaquinone biosynthesis C-methylase UbiE
MNLVISAYRKIAPKYEAVMGSIYQYAPRQIDRFFDSLPKGGAVLDAGCGPGFESAVGARRGLRMTGLDACEEMLARFSAGVPAGTALHGDVTLIPADDGSFDAVFSSCVLLHLAPAAAIAALREMRRVLKPKGRLFLVTDVSRGEEEWHSRPALSEVGVDSLYFYHWEKDSLLKAVASTGFEISGAETLPGVPGRPSLIIVQAAK